MAKPKADTSTPPAPRLDHSRSLWRSPRLGSALRTSLACMLVGVATLYSPTSLRRHLHFPAFSYMTAVLVVGDASSLGSSTRSAACASYGILLGLLPAMLTFYSIRPEGVSAATTAVAVAISSFVVAVSDSPGLITTRVALGQVVIVYVTAYKETGHTKPVMLHPVPVAASTAVGAAAAVLALLFPYPKLACHQVEEKTNIYTEMTKERLRVLVNAFCADSTISRSASEFKAKSLAAACKKFLQNIKLLQGSVHWERPPPLKFLPPPCNVPWERLEAMELCLKGMEIALASSTSPASTKMVDQRLKDDLIGLSNHIISSTELKNFPAERSGGIKTDVYKLAFQSLPTIPQHLHCLPSLFFLFCNKLLLDVAAGGGAVINPLPNPRGHDDHNKITPAAEDVPPAKRVIAERAIAASKCSLSLGLAVLFGVLFSRDDGYWSGLTAAIAFAPHGGGRATFGPACARAHGTALGSVYGVLGSLVSQSLMEVRLLALLPWVVFASLLRRSRAYGPAGSLGAAISAAVILGRRGYGPPMAFAINRLTETYIGLCCSVSVELLLQPSRASTLARKELSRSLHVLREWLQSATSAPAESREKQLRLREAAGRLGKCIEEVATEPNFWFRPFPAASYGKLHGSLARVGELAFFLAQSMEFLQPLILEVDQEAIRVDLEHFKEMVDASVECFEEAVQVESMEKELQNNRSGSTSCYDVELGRRRRRSPPRHDDEEECEKIVASLLQHSKEAMERLDENVGADVKEQLVLCFASVCFCVEGIMREIRETGKGILELIQSENPWCDLNLYDIIML